MSAWNSGVFEDDIAGDMAQQAMATGAAEYLAEVAETEWDDYLEVDDAQAIIVAGVILDAVLKGSRYPNEEPGFDEWLNEQDPAELSGFVDPIAKRLQWVLRDESELNELWAEGGEDSEDYLSWRQGIESIIANLTGLK